MASSSPPKKDANPQAARLGTGDVTTASKQLGPSRCASWARFAVRVWFAVPSMAFPRNTQKFRQLFHLDLRLFSTVGSETVIGHAYKHSDYGWTYRINFDPQCHRSSSDPICCSVYIYISKYKSTYRIISYNVDSTCSCAGQLLFILHIEHWSKTSDSSPRPANFMLQMHPKCC